MSYRKKHVKSKIHKIQPKKSVFRTWWFWSLILFVVLFFTAGYFFLFFPGFQVKTIVISGNEKASTQELQQTVLNDANTVLVNFWIIKITSRSIFLVNSQDLNQQILKEFPVIEKLSVHKNFPQSLIVGVTERKPLGIYCSGQTENDKCFLIDQSGVAFEELSANPNNLAIIKQTAENSDIYTGENVIGQSIMDTIYKIQSSLKEKFKINLQEAFVSSPTRLDVQTSEGWKIYFNIENNSNISMQIAKLNLLLAGDLSLENRKNLRYIDLRPKDRAIICDNSTCAN